MSETKRCPRCGETKPLDMFHRDRTNKDGRQDWCRSCYKEYQATALRDPTHPAHDAMVKNKHKTQDKRAVKGSDYYWVSREAAWKRYGVLNSDGTPFLRQDYKDLWALQEGHCGLCGTPLEHIRVHVDHEHRDGTSGPVRSLVCGLCNRNRIGVNDMELVKKLFAYFEFPPASRLPKPEEIL